MAVTLLSDTALFVTHATWLGPRLPQPTIGAFACWLAPWLRGACKRELEAMYRINHPIQRAAEIELIELLQAAPRRLEQRVRIDDQAGRLTDWPSTLTLAHPLAPARFVQQSRSSELDNGLLAGLATIGRQWSYMLVEYGDQMEEHKRVQDLRKATRPFGRGQLTLAHLRRLGRLPQAESKLRSLRQALELMTLPLTAPQSVSAIETLAARLSAMGSELENQNDALEVSVILSIARAAQNLGWSIAHANADRVRPKPRLALAKGDLRCTITKGRFEYPAEPKRQAIDALRRLETVELGLNSTGRQPDVVISFWNVHAPEDVYFCIADAKRNQSGDGVAYLKNAIVSMTAYMVSFSEPLRACLSAEVGGFAAPLMPTATLFLQQAAFVHNEEARETAVGRSRNPAWLATLDARHYAMAEDGVWHDKYVRAWFQRISDCAARSVRSRRAARRPEREASTLR